MAIFTVAVSCASVPDVPVCYEVNMATGFCTYTISDKDFYITDEIKYDGKTWFDMRPELVMLPASSYAELKSYIIKSCKNNKACKDNIGSWERKLNALDPTNKK